MKTSRILGVGAVIVILLGVLYWTSLKQIEKFPREAPTEVSTTPPDKLDCTDFINYNKCYGTKDGKGA